MNSFLSESNINYLKYQLRKKYPENNWKEIQDDIKSYIIEWFKEHPQNMIIAQNSGTKGLNEKFLDDIIRSRMFVDCPTSIEMVNKGTTYDDISYSKCNSSVLGESHLFMGGVDPNIENQQFMPVMTEWPKKITQRGNNYEIPQYNLYSTNINGSTHPNNLSNYNSREYTTGISSPYAEPPRDTDTNFYPHRKSTIFDGSTPFTSKKSFINHKKKQPFSGTLNQGTSLGSFGQEPSPYTRFSDTANLATQSMGKPWNHGQYKDRVNYGLDQVNPNWSQDFNLNRIDISGTYDAAGIRGIGSRFYSNDMSTKIGESVKTLRSDQILNNEANKWFTGGPLDNAVYNTPQNINRPNHSNYFPYDNRGSVVKNTLTQMKFGDVPVVSSLDANELTLLGHQLYRMNHRPKLDKVVNWPEYNEPFDDQFTVNTRERFHLDEIYNTPESQISTANDPIFGRSRLIKDQSRKQHELPLFNAEFIPYPNKDYVISRYDQSNIF